MTTEQEDLERLDSILRDYYKQVRKDDYEEMERLVKEEMERQS